MCQQLTGISATPRLRVKMLLGLLMQSKPFEGESTRNNAMQQNDWVFCFPSSAMSDLLATRHSRRGNRCIRCCTNCGKQSHLADLHRELVMRPFEAERASHAAASGVEHRHLGAGNAFEELHRWRQCTRGLLVAVAVEKDGCRAWGLGDGE